MKRIAKACEDTPPTTDRCHARTNARSRTFHTHPRQDGLLFSTFSANVENGRAITHSNARVQGRAEGQAGSNARRERRGEECWWRRSINRSERTTPIQSHMNQPRWPPKFEMGPPPRIECRAAQLMDGEDEQTWVFYSAKRGIMDARARAVPHGDERPIWATVHSGGSERIAHAVEHPRTSASTTTHVFNRAKERKRERESKRD